MIDLNIISVFCRLFDLHIQLQSSFRSAVIFRCATKKLFDFLFSNWFLHVPFAFIFFSNVSRYSTRMEVLLNLVSIWPLKSITTHACIFNFLGFCGVFCCAVKK